MTSRPLPLSDPEVDQLAPEQRDELAEVWLARAASERRVSDAFVAVRFALERLESSPQLLSLAARAVDDELRHAELCRVVASRFAGRELAEPERLSLAIPQHRGATDDLLPSLHVIGHAALNETFASAFLEVCLEFAKAPLARAAVRELLSDEIDHARIGWAHLAESSAARRKSLAPWLFSLAHANLKMWRDTPRAYPADAALHRHGAPPAEAVERALVGAVRDLVIPGFASLGLPTGPLATWAARGAPTTDAVLPA